jgi:hypothetical protein
VTSSAHLTDLAPDGLNAMLDDLGEIGCDVAVCAFMPPERFADLDAIKASAEALNKANEIAASRGVSLGYHHHWWEFSTIIAGQTAWSALVERLDPTVFAELDIEFPWIEIAAFADGIPERAEKFADRYGGVALDLVDMLADDSIDAVVNLTPAHAHTSVSRICLEAAKPVFSEKPLGTDFEEGRSLVQLAGEKGLRLGCAPDTFLGAGL